MVPIGEGLMGEGLIGTGRDSRPTVSLLTDELYRALGHLTDGDEANDWALLKFCAGWVEKLLDPVYALVQEGKTTVPWETLLDPVACPASLLPYLAQFVGAILTPGMDEVQRRVEIEQPTGWSRGWVGSIVLAAQRNLTGNKTVIIRTRKPEVGHLYIRTLASETPDPERTRADILTQKPAWELLDYEATEGITWADITAAYEDFAHLTARFANFEALTHALITEIP